MPEKGFRGGFALFGAETLFFVLIFLFLIMEKTLPIVGILAGIIAAMPGDDAEARNDTRRHKSRDRRLGDRCGRGADENDEWRGRVRLAGGIHSASRHRVRIHQKTDHAQGDHRRRRRRGALRPIQHMPAEIWSLPSSWPIQVSPRMEHAPL